MKSKSAGTEPRRPDPDGHDPLDHAVILVVEDDPSSRDALALVLRQYGAEVTAVPSAIAALTRYHERRPQLIVSDVCLEDGIGGCGLISLIRHEETDRGQPHAPAIALSGMGGAEVRERALSAGFDRFVAKPIVVNDLLRAARRALSRP